MTCPNCGERMKPMTRDEQTFLHCLNCGSSYFEDNGINRISLETAEQLKIDNMHNRLSRIAALKKCPRDETIMRAVVNSAAVPQNVVLYHCDLCNGILTNADDLLRFKQAQIAKVNYFRIWEMPLPGLQAVLVVLLIAVITGGIFLGVDTVQRQNSYTTQARDITNTISVNRSGRYILIHFKTKTPFNSELVVTNRTKSETLTYPVSKYPIVNHNATLTIVNLEDELYYHVKLTDSKGYSVTTEEKKLR